MARINHEVTVRQKLLDEKGNIREPGYAKTLIWEYSRDDIKANDIRIKEWDYYYIGNRDHALCLTVSDSGYVSCLSASILTFGDKPEQYNDSEIGPFPMGSLDLPSTSEKGDIDVEVGTCKMKFENDGVTRRLVGSYENFCKDGTLEFDIVLSDIPKESMVIATPFNKDKHFYYNQKINCMKAKGYAKWKGKEYRFDEDSHSMATLDWGRGVWTYDNTWYWGSGQTVLEDGSTFGFNIGYGFGDTRAASENMLFYNGTAHKLDDVTFNIPKDANGEYLYMEPWTFTSSDGRFEMDFKPIIDRVAPIDLKVICMLPHQVFGLMTGKAVLDDGRVIEIKDTLVFAERVHNKW